MESEQEQWQRARALYTQVLQLGTRSPHRADALFYLGWTEYRLENRSGARLHFGAFVESFPEDPRNAEAAAMAVICRAEELMLQAQRLNQTPDADARKMGREKFLELVTLADCSHYRLQNHGYRSILKNLARDAGFGAWESLEEDQEFAKADTLYFQLRRILGIACPETDLRDRLSGIIMKHLQAPEHEFSSLIRKERARTLLHRLTNDFPAAPRNPVAISPGGQCAPRTSEPATLTLRDELPPGAESQGEAFPN